ncbi:MAG: hypothetical protein K2H36_00425 [Clostridia bacterium]|nr:hypothetical protein [Clostridia bacterium]
MAKDKKITEKDVYELTWQYFKFHAQQRLTYLNYFIVFSMALTTALIGVLTSSLKFLGIIIGIMQMLFGFIFIKIDNRNAFLTKLSEQILKEFESQFGFSDDLKYLEQIKIFTQEEKLSAKRKMMSHRKSYKAIIYSFSILGGLGTIASIVLTILTNIKL